METKNKSFNAGKQILAKLNEAKKNELIEVRASQKIALQAFKEAQRKELDDLREKQRTDLDNMVQQVVASLEIPKVGEEAGKDPAGKKGIEKK